MKKLIYILIPLLFSFLCISTQSYKIAVLPFKSSSNQGITQSIPDMIMTNLGNSKKITIVERVQIDRAIQHFQTEQSELINDTTAVEIGQWIGVNAIIIGNYVQVGGQFRIDAHVVDVKSGTLINSAKVQGLSYDIFDLVDNLSEEILALLTGVISSDKNQDYYFHSSTQLLTGKDSYVRKELDATNSNDFRVDYVTHNPAAHLVGKLNTGENLDLSTLLYLGGTDAINLESDKTYQITFSGNHHFQANVYAFGFNVSYYINVNVEFYGTDTFTLRPNETNIIQVDIARPPQLISHIRNNAKMRWELQVTNK
jgi:TolB-like protein